MTSCVPYEVASVMRGNRTPIPGSCARRQQHVWIWITSNACSRLGRNVRNPVVSRCFHRKFSNIQLPKAHASNKIIPHYKCTHLFDLIIPIRCVCVCVRVVRFTCTWRLRRAPHPLFQHHPVEPQTLYGNISSGG